MNNGPTRDQRVKFFAEWWPAACAAQQWDPNDRTFRLAKIAEIIGRPVRSINDLDRLRDFDVLIPALSSLARPDNLAAAMRAVEAVAIGERKRLVHAVNQLARDLGYADAEAVLQGRLSHRFGSEIAALDNQDLAHLRITLTRMQYSRGGVALVQTL